jgi:putative nucleotidyltransferase with HDIG domain
MVETILFVDDEESVLNSLKRIFADGEYRTCTALDAVHALELIRNEKVAVLVADNMMPGMRGMELLELTSSVSPTTVKIMMTAFADLPTMVDAINRGEVFRFIVKPWDNDELVSIVREGMERHRLLESLRRQDEAVLYALAETIELKDPYTKGHCERVAQYALMIADALQMPQQVKDDLRHGSWLHDCGKIGVPERILNASRKLDEEELSMIRRHPAWGAEVARKARMPRMVINIIQFHHERCDGCGYPSGLVGEEIPIEARIVAIADTYDALTTVRPYHDPHPADVALDILRMLSGVRLDPALTELFITIISERGVSPLLGPPGCVCLEGCPEHG